MMNLISILSGSDLIGFDNFTMNNFKIELKTILLREFILILCFLHRKEV